MSSSAPRRAPQSTNALDTTPSFFELQRAALISEIGISMEHVLQNINKLNRNLEGVIAVGNEFSSVEALWSQFENVMHKEPETSGDDGDKSQGEGLANDHDHDHDQSHQNS